MPTVAQKSSTSQVCLFINRLQALGNHLARVTVNRHVEPIAAFAFNVELVKLSGAGWIPAGLSNQVDKQVPRARVAHFGKSADGGFAAGLEVVVLRRAVSELGLPLGDQFATV